MKKFCSIVQSSYPNDRRIRKQCEQLISNGYSVTVICLKGKDQAKYDRINGVRVHRVNLARKRASKMRYLFEYSVFFVSAFIKLNRLYLKNRFDIIQVSNLPDFLVFVTVIQKIRGAKIILDMHEITPEFFVSKYRRNNSSIIVKVLKVLEKVSLKFADEVITINETIRQVFNQRSIPDKSITVIMNTIDESIVSKCSIEKGPNFNIVYHGYLDELYGLDIALKALHEFHKVNNNFRFYIFGYGQQKDYLDLLTHKLGLEDHVTLMGLVSFEDMMKYLELMTIGILPIRKDVFSDLSFSNKLGEYIYFKIPVISSDLKTTQYYFSDEEITYFSSGDPFDCNKQICFAFNNPQLMRNKAEKAFMKYQSIKWSIMSQRYLDLINSQYETERPL